MLAFNVWGSLADNPGPRVMQEVVAEFFPADPPRFLDVPHDYHDVGFWNELLSAHGFVECEHEVVTLELRSATAEQFAYGQICGSPFSHEIRERGGAFEEILASVTAALTRLGGEAPFRCPMRAIVFTARAG